MPVQTRSQTRALAQVSAPVPVPVPAHTFAPLDFAEEMKTRLRAVLELDLELTKIRLLRAVSELDLELTQTRLFDDKYRILIFLKLQTIDNMLCFIISRLPKIYTHRSHSMFLKTLSEKIAEFKLSLNSSNIPTTPTEIWVVQHFKDTLHMCEAMVTHIKTLHA